MKRIVTGPRAVVEALRAAADNVHVIYVAEGSAAGARELMNEASRRGVRVEESSAAELDALARGNRHQGAVAVTGPYPYAELADVLAHAAEPPLLVALDQITDPHNLGAIVRSAVAFGADGVLTLKDRAAPVTPVVVRASAGATEHARIVRVTNLARTLGELNERGLQTVGLDMAGEIEVDALPEAPLGRVLVVGAEGKGLRRLVRERCSLLAQIRQPGPIGSLNASVAASIALFCAARGRFPAA